MNKADIGYNSLLEVIKSHHKEIIMSDLTSSVGLESHYIDIEEMISEMDLFDLTGKEYSLDLLFQQQNIRKDMIKQKFSHLKWDMFVNSIEFDKLPVQSIFNIGCSGCVFRPFG